MPDARPRDPLHLRGLRPRHGYVLVLALVLVVVIVASATPEEPWARSVLVLLAGSVLVVALWAAAVPRRLFRLGLVAIPLAVAAAAVILAGNEAGRRTATGGIVAGLFVFAVPIAIGYGIAKRPEVTFHSVFGAAAIYLLIGVFFAFVFDAAHKLGEDPFFAQPIHLDRADLLYFSFSTLTTVGFGDLTAAGSVGRTLAVMEAIVGQLYLVVVVAFIVAGLAATRRR